MLAYMQGTSKLVACVLCDKQIFCARRFLVHVPVCELIHEHKQEKGPTITQLCNPLLVLESYPDPRANILNIVLHVHERVWILTRVLPHSASSSADAYVGRDKVRCRLIADMKGMRRYTLAIQM